jgi:hypothetical protein
MKKQFVVVVATVILAGCSFDSTTDSVEDLPNNTQTNSIASVRSLLVNPTKLVLNPKACRIGDFGGLTDGCDDGYLVVTALDGDQCEFEFKHGGCGGNSSTYRCRIPIAGPAVAVEVVNGILTTSFELKESDIIARDGPNAG